ncbi:MAG: DMT family transporter [Eubacteriales bacterium]|jgi:drug/metabolite transporter (DMT)-like permease|nr:DMT family transporter [Eubacteriales bacterium]MDD4134383.1 DMT family transporter [Eubacteriales bacterium]NLO14136.1 DMT family transporter [Clostridiales bacterium]
MTDHRKGVLMLLATSLIWGAGFVAAEYALLSGLKPHTIMALRFTIGALAIGAIYHKRLRGAGLGVARRGLSAGVLLFFAFYTQILGQELISVAATAFLTSTNVVMIPFILWALERRRPAGRVFLLSALTLTGVAFLSFSGGGGMGFGLGELLVLLCALLFAGHIVFLGRYCLLDDPARITFWQLAGAAATALLVLFFRGEAATPAQWGHGIWPAVYLGFFSTCLCYYLQTAGQRYVPPAQAGIIMSMEAVFGTVFSLLLGLEIMRPGMAMGGGLIILSLVLMERGAGKRAIPIK